MMSYLYPEDEVTFDKSGFGPLPDMLESYAEEEANSYFELYFEYPLFSSHERGDHNQIYVNMSDYLIEGNQVTYKPSHSREPHAFRIYKTDKQVERGIILVWARTRTADLRGNPVRKVKSNGVSVSSALKALKMASEETHPFSFTTNIQSNISFEKTQTNVLDALAGEEDSILAITGGQMIRTNNNIYIGINESSKNIVEFRLGKNIEGISYEVDYSNVVTAVIPFYTQTYKLVDDIRDEIVRDSSGKIVKNPDGTTKYNRTVGKKRESLDKEVIVYGDTVFSPYANDYSTPFYSFVEIRDDREDVGLDKDPLPPFTKTDINKRAVDWFDWEENLGIDEPEVSVTVDVHDISQSSEYSHNVNLAKLETLNVFDKALVYVPEVGIDMDMEINYIRYDGVAEKNLEVRLGTTLTSLTETVLSPQQRAFNQRVQQLDREIEKSLMSSDGKSRVYWMATKPVGQFEIGDLWFDISLDGGIYVWDGYDWVAKLPPEFGKLIEESVNNAIEAAESAMQEAQTKADKALLDAKAYADAQDKLITQQVTTSVNTAISTAEAAKSTAESSYTNAVAEAERLAGEQSTAFNKKFEENATAMGKLSQAAKDADTKAQSALTKAGVNANLLTTHQNTLDTIKNTTIPAVKSSAQDALTSAKNAMDEAKKADGKIAAYVTAKGLVNGTTVDSKIDTATGEISRKITTVESKIPTGAGINLIAQSAEGYEDGYIVDIVEIGQPLAIRTYHMNTISGYIDIGNKGVSEPFTFSKQMTGKSDEFFRIAWLSEFGNVLQRDADNSEKVTIESPPNAVQVRLSFPTGSKPKMEKGSVATPWTPAPEDNYTQEEFKIFESTYDEDVKGINSTLTDLSNKKLDGSTYTTFYNNEYKKTAQGVTDTYTKVNKIIDANGNSTDTFAKAVYDRNATRQSADFKEVTKDLVKTATYTAGVKGINQSITTIQGKLDNLQVGGRNLLRGTADFDTSFWQNVQTARDSTRDSRYKQVRVDGDHTVAPKTDMATQGWNFEVGQDYVISVWAKSEALGNKIGVTPEGSKLYFEPQVVAVSEWRRFVWKFKSTSSDLQSFRFETRNDERVWITQPQIEKGSVPTDWSLAEEDMLGQADFQIFKGTYESNDKTIKARLLAIDSGKEGSVVTRLNATEKTASGNTTTISNIKTKPGEQITGYQTILERSNLYERVIGKDETSVKSNISRIVQTSEVIQQTVTSAMNVENRNLLITKNATKDSWLTGNESYPNPSSATSSGTSTSPDLIEVKSGDKFTLSKNETTLYFRVSFLNSSKKYIGRYVQNAKLETIVPPSGTAYMWVSYPTNADAKVEKGTIATGYSPAPEDTATQSQVTQLSDSWSMKLKKADDVVTQINATSAGVLIQGKSIQLDGNVTMTSYFQVPNANIKDLAVNKITGTNAQFTTMITKGLTADVITSTMIKADTALFNMLFSTTSATDRLIARGAWITNANIVSLDASKITAGTINSARINAGQIVTNGLSANVVKSTHIQGDTALIDKVFATTALINRLTSKTAFISSIQAISINASKITSGTLDASKVTVTNIDASKITANKTAFVQSSWNAINSEVSIDGSGIKTQKSNGDFSRIVSGELRSFNADSSSTAILGSGRSQYFDKAGSQFILGNTLHGTEWINDGTLQVTHNRRFAIGRYADYAVSNGLFHPYIALEYPAGKTGDEPLGLVRFYKAVYLQKDIYAGNNAVSGLSKITFHNGGNIESQPKTSNMLIGASNKLVVYASGANAFEIDSGYMYLKRNLSMEGNKITNQSDRRLKTNIVDTPVNSLSAISSWAFKAFDRVNNGAHDDIGVIAQDTSDIVVYDKEHDIYNVDSSKQIMMNSHGIQQLNTKVDEELAQLKAQIATLQKELALAKGV